MGVSAGPRVGVGLSVAPDARDAAREACSQAHDALGTRRPSLAVAFASPELWTDGERLAAALAVSSGAERLVAVMSDTIIAGRRELAETPALAVWLADLPSAIVRVRHLRATQGATGLEISSIDDLCGSRVRAPLIALCDPFTFPTDLLLDDIGQRGHLCVGGLASGGGAPGEHRLLIDGRVVNEGAVLIALEGVSALAVVSQGCAPIGPEMVVTDADGSLVRALAGRPALTRIEEILAELPAAEHARAENGLLAGLVIDENRPEYGIGDYLMRGILGVDRDTGEIMIGERVRIGQTMRLHVRDPEVAAADLTSHLKLARRAAGDSRIVGGTRLQLQRPRPRHVHTR